MDDIFADDYAMGRKYAVRHVIVAPRENATIEEMMQVIRALRRLQAPRGRE